MASKDKEFQRALWISFRRLQQDYIVIAERRGDKQPYATSWANQQINELTNVELIDALSG
jgi:hypothetical protein